MPYHTTMVRARLQSERVRDDTPKQVFTRYPDDARSRGAPSVLKEARPFWKKTRNARATPISHHTPRHKYVLVGRWLLGRWLPPRLPPRLARGALRAARCPVSPDSSRGRSKPLPCLAPCSARLRLGKGCFARVASLRRCSLSTALPSLFPPPGTCSVRSLALSARIFSETGATTRSREYPCIRCGYCVDACPLFLNPCELALLARNAEYERMASELHLMDCFECGSCTFVCPSHIPLVQHFRVAKSAVRKARAAG